MSWDFVSGCVVMEFGFSGGEMVDGSAEKNLARERAGKRYVHNEVVVCRKIKSIELSNQSSCLLWP